MEMKLHSEKRKQRVGCIKNIENTFQIHDGEERQEKEEMKAERETRQPLMPKEELI